MVPEAQHNLIICEIKHTYAKSMDFIWVKTVEKILSVLIYKY